MNYLSWGVESIIPRRCTPHHSAILFGSFLWSNALPRAILLDMTTVLQRFHWARRLEFFTLTALPSQLL